jgi:nitrate/nitrite-specific signal transduction histidine kinase
MGWGRMFLLGNWGQQMDIEEQKEEIEGLKQQLNESYVGSRGALDLQSRVARLEIENNELRLYLAALVKYLGRQGTINQYDFRKLVEAIDAEDGQTDGGYKGRIAD